ncbi:hypothetical protein PAHAL_9G373200 [Panicum hallii]|uniref:Uncharacterized protein n=1 Tax=Panicum hallii TaxID=206008 RepID=A0A2T8I3U6_9POAL|nr:hypothetical protein PAHAL_9G373200 [Panicum hallii]
MSDELEGVGEEANVLTPDRRELPRTPWTRNVRWRARGRGFEGNGVLGLGARRTRGGWKCVRRWGGRGCLNLGVISVRALQQEMAAQVGSWPGRPIGR